MCFLWLFDYEWVYEEAEAEEEEKHMSNAFDLDLSDFQQSSGDSRNIFALKFHR